MDDLIIPGHLLELIMHEDGGDIAVSYKPDPDGKLDWAIDAWRGMTQLGWRYGGTPKDALDRLELLWM
jgi:hypothetical protein